MEPYEPRPILPLGVVAHGGWRVKTYSVAYHRERARPALLAAAETAAAATLPVPAMTAIRYGVGFLGVHDGRDANFAFVDWWESENELHHHVFFSASAEPGRLRPQRAGDPVGCVWDLRIVAHEREAWIRHVLAAPAPDFDAYLTDTISGPI